jgi:alanine dehydrogenase
MNVGIPKERRDLEYRVGLTPAGVQILTEDGHRVYVESGAGVMSGFSDEHYRQASGQVVYSLEEVYGRSDLLIKVARPTSQEFELLREGQIVMSFLHLAMADPRRLRTLVERKVTAIAYEMIQANDGRRPVLEPISQIAGRMAPQVAARFLESAAGGRGILLSGVPGIPPAEVVILGAGVVGTNAARVFLGLGANVYMLDRNLAALQKVDDLFQGRATTMVSYPFNLHKVVKFADVLVGCVLVPGARTPVLVTREMVRTMKPGSVILDISIDQGGCVETSRPTTHRDPVFIEEQVIHYCVPNMTGVLARTATHALNNAAWPFIQQIVALGLEQAMQENSALARGVNTHKGEVIHPGLKQALR